jgi:hypothetical protein
VHGENADRLYIRILQWTECQNGRKLTVVARPLMCGRIFKMNVPVIEFVLAQDVERKLEKGGYFDM